MTTERETNVPYPPRFRWLKRLSLAVVVLAACLVALRVWWGQRMGALLAADHARMRAAGQPVARADFDPPPVPDGANAAAYLRQAIAVQNTTLGPSASSVAFPDSPPYPAQWHAMADAAAAANAAALAPLRQARAHDAADWGVGVRSPTSPPLFPLLNQARGLANTSGDAAMREHLRGNDAAALELARDVRHLARSVDRQPWLISHIVATGCEALALNRIMMMAPALEVAPGGEDVRAGSAVPDGPATRGQVKALIAELAGPDARRLSAAAGLASERMVLAESVRAATAGNPVLRPLYQAEERRVLAATEWFAPAAAQQTWSGLRAVLASRPAGPPRSGPGRIGNLLSRTMLPALQGTFDRDIHVEAERRMTAVSLAVRLYRIDRGAWPASLDELVPAYLPAVPADPFAPAGEPLRYVLNKGGMPSGEDRPMVYSVGENQADDTATGLLSLPPGPRYKLARGDADERRDLARWQPATPGPTTTPATTQTTSATAGPTAPGPAAPGATGPASPKAVEDEPDKPGDPRDGD